VAGLCATRGRIVCVQRREIIGEAQWADDWEQRTQSERFARREAALNHLEPWTKLFILGLPTSTTDELPVKQLPKPHDKPPREIGGAD
jgi:hypothetical protein